LTPSILDSSFAAPALGLDLLPVVGWLALAAVAALAETALMLHSRARLLARVDPARQGRLELRLASVDEDLLVAAVVKGGALLGMVAAWFQAQTELDVMAWVTLGGILLAALVLCQTLPAAVCVRHAETVVLRSLPLLRVLRWITFVPLTVPVGSLRRLLVRLLGGAETRPADREELADQILAAVEDTAPDNALKAEEKQWIENIVELRDVDVAEAMTPRTDMIAVEANTPLDEAVRNLTRSGHSRFPVFEGRLDSVVGILHLKDAFARLIDSKGQPDAPTVRAAMRPPCFVPESKRIADLLREFRAQRLQVAVVLDEYGGTAGLITIEDIVEEIVGEIDSEHDRAREVGLTRLADGLAEVDARMRVAEVNEQLDLQLTEAEDYDTMGGFVLSHLGKVPKPGEKFTAHDVEFTVLKADARRIGRLRLKLLKQPQPTTAE
jgi:putative hemolysin